MKRSKFFPVIFLAACFLHAQSNDTNKVMPWFVNTGFKSYLLREIHSQYKQRAENINQALKNIDDFKGYQSKVRESTKLLLGQRMTIDWPLLPKVAGSTKFKGFHVERVLFESMPGRHVTGDLYVPDGKGPFPVVLVVAGHTANGKIGYQSIAILLTQNKIAAFAVDPVSQGERVQLFDKNGKNLTERATTEHTLLNSGATLLGTNLATMICFDNSRAIDYLATRPEIDITKLGCLGTSGGGTQTAFLCAYDDRIKIASISSFMTRRERQVEVFGVDDGCQFIPSESALQIEIADYVMAFAPKPLKIMSSTFDFVDYFGAKQSFEELSKAYTVLGAPQNISMFTFEGGHGMPLPEREAVTSWMKNYFYRDTTILKEDKGITIPDSILTVTQKGQVVKEYSGEMSITKSFSGINKNLQNLRNSFLSQDRSDIVTAIKRLISYNDDTALPKWDIIKEQKTSQATVYFVQVQKPGEVPIPCIIYKPKTKSFFAQTVSIILDENGKNIIIEQQQRLIDSLLSRNNVVLLADLRGVGETDDPLEPKVTKFWFREYTNAMLSLQCGKTLLGQRVNDITTILDFMDQFIIAEKPVYQISANGLYIPPVIHAALFDSRISKVLIQGQILSYTSLLENPYQKFSYGNIVPSALKYYDLPDLVKLIGDTRIAISQ
jgi:cephalosporin-C deacetylase-like acetyl esterase